MSAKEEAEVVTEKNKRSNSNASLETVQAELINLVKATKDVSVLDTIIQQLKKQSINSNEEKGKVEGKPPSSKRICRRRHSSSHDVDDDDDDDGHSIQSALYGQTLCSIVGWLGPKDLLSCVQVCKQWKKDIDIFEEENIDNRDPKQHKQQQNRPQQQKMLWKQAATNHAPSLVKAIEERHVHVSSSKKESSSSLSSSPSSSSFNSSDLTMKKKKDLNYKSIAKGLVYKKSISDNESGRNCNDSNFFIPKLKFADLIMFVEAIDTKTGKILGSWHISLDNKIRNFLDDLYLISKNDEIEKKTLLPPFLEEGKYEDYFPEYKDPSEDTPWDILVTRICFTARLFRCDTGESFCFGFDETDNPKQGFTGRFKNKVVLGSVDVQPDITTEAGIRATAFWHNQDIMHMAMRLNYEIDPVVPTNYLQQQQQQQRGGNKIHGDQSWRKIRHRIKKLWFQFRLGLDDGLDNEDDCQFILVDELLLSLEGLAWKK